MISKAITFILGFSFALGLGISQMTRPQKVLAFLDVLGDWDPSLLLVMAGAVGVYFVLQRYLLRLPAPRFESKFSLPKASKPDMALVAGAAIFGMGWGTVGFCPGPSVVALSSGLPKVILFFIGICFGMWAQRKYG